MIRVISDFTQTWKVESQSTLKVFSNLTDESLGQKVYEGGRTLGFIAKHIISTLCDSDMPGKIGIRVSMTEKEIKALKTVEELKTAYAKLSIEILDAVLQWKDEDLLEEVDLYGQSWTKGFTLYVLINHQIHHRGQMTVLMRQAGLKVPGVCGPSKEEWAAFNVPAQE
jgi:uncharacterized damage-inducible protein DinB